MRKMKEMDIMGGEKEAVRMRQKVFRWVFYLVGMIVLAVGLTLNTKTGLGVSAIMSIPFAISEIWRMDFGNVTLVVYIIFIVIQMVLHICMARKRGNHRLGFTLLLDVLQFPLSLAFTRVINLVSRLIPVLSEAYPHSFVGSFAGRLAALLVAVILTGVGAAMTLNMRIAPNPGDGIIQVLADTTGKPVGFTKNWFDVLNVCVNLALGLICSGGIVGVGLGTIVAALGVGRVIALFNRLLKEKLCSLAGL